MEGRKDEWRRQKKERMRLIKRDMTGIRKQETRDK